MKRTAILLGILGALAILGCSQNQVSYKGPAPKAPVNAPDAEVVPKTTPGMNQMPTAEEQQKAQEQARSPRTDAKTDTFTFRGQVVLPKSLEARFKKGSTLFIIARDKNNPTMPVAAKKLIVQSFPVPFELTQADAMSDSPIPPHVELLARLDRDGNLTTTSPDDMDAGPVNAEEGQAVTLTLRPAAK